MSVLWHLRGQLSVFNYEDGGASTRWSGSDTKKGVQRNEAGERGVLQVAYPGSETASVKL